MNKKVNESSRDITRSEVALIIGLFRKGWKPKDIAAKVGRTLETVKKYLHLKNEEGASVPTNAMKGSSSKQGPIKLYDPVMDLKHRRKRAIRDLKNRKKK